jgi:hypothetical protein
MSFWLSPDPLCRALIAAGKITLLCAATSSSMSGTQPVINGASGNFQTAPTPVQSVLRAVLASAGVPKHPSEIDPDLPVIESLEVVSTSRTDAILAWPKPSIIPPGWIVEVAYVTVDPRTQTFFKMWVRHREWEKTYVKGDRLAVRVKSLQPASIYEMRVLAINNEGLVSEPATFATVRTKLPWRIPLAVWTTLVGIALGFLGYRLYRLRPA